MSGGVPAAYVGLMSGTSLDGITAAMVRFTGSGDTLETELVAWDVVEYSAEQRERLREHLVDGTARSYCRLAFDLGEWLARAATLVIDQAGVPRSEIRAIGSHGQTIWHEPPHSTWQIGESAVIAERTRVDVVSDFRVADVAAGGQGAPLVPIADAMLFSASHWRALQNIGGIGNVTVLPPRSLTKGMQELSAVRAFDTGPGVAVIDGVVRSLYPDLRYDDGGRIAASGRVHEEVLEDLLAAPYFAESPPKSTGRELFDSSYVDRLVARCGGDGADPSDAVATATALTAASIADAFRRFVPEPVAELLLSGGGARNETLVEMIRARLAGIEVRDFADVYFDGEAKEAVAFALLAHLHVTGRSGNVPSATGARGGRVLGKLSPAPSTGRGRAV
jgi:anhydro-N-acetylmuramic acid kinase